MPEQRPHEGLSFLFLPIQGVFRKKEGGGLPFPFPSPSMHNQLFEFWIRGMHPSGWLLWMEGVAGWWSEQGKKNAPIRCLEGYPHRDSNHTPILPALWHRSHACASGYGNSIQGSEGYLYFSRAWNANLLVCNSKIGSCTVLVQVPERCQQAKWSHSCTCRRAFPWYCTCALLMVCYRDPSEGKEGDG